MVSFSRQVRLFGAMLVTTVMLAFAAPASAQQSSGYSFEEVISQGHNFFGTTAGGLASVIEHAFQQYGVPNGYILG